MDQKERMLKNLPYKAWMDGLSEERRACQEKLWEFNNLPPERWEERPALLKKLLGGLGERSMLLPPLRCDYGTNIFIGEGVEINYNLTVLDVGRVHIGDRVLIAPNVSIYTAGHPIHPDSRNSAYEYGKAVTIGDNVWIGGNTVICPGVTIGSNTAIGAGSVVTHDIPDWCVAAGNPCRVIRRITEADRRKLYKNEMIDDEAWSDIVARGWGGQQASEDRA